jgi:protein-L-isoaspartate(D-aspartate) O-methyltransferase
VSHDRVVDAFAAVPRERFLPAGQRRFAHLDRPLPIGHGQTNSQPTTVRNMLRLLDVQPGQRVLDVGCGSGWTTALLGRLVGPDGWVLGLEIIPALVEFGRANLSASTLPWASIRAADPDVLGAPDEAPYDRILVSAEASALPTGLVDQLTADGVLVVPVRGVLTSIHRSAAGIQVHEHGAYSFVPLREPSGPR